MCKRTGKPLKNFVLLMSFLLLLTLTTSCKNTDSAGIQLDLETTTPVTHSEAAPLVIQTPDTDQRKTFLNPIPSGTFSPFTLHERESISSGNLAFVLQSDGNLVLYQDGNVVLWNSETFGTCDQLGSCKTIFQTDGNLVIYSGSTPIWASNTFGNVGAKLVISNLFPYLKIQNQKGDQIWSSAGKLKIELLANSMGAPNCFSGQANLLTRIYNYKTVYSPGSRKTIQLRAHVISPANFNPSTSYPVIAMFHGGAWKTGSPMYWLPEARYFASLGAVTVTFQYRLFNSDRSTIEESTADARSAVRWLKKYSKELSIDPNRIVTAGDSAGGHLAIATGLVDKVSDEIGTSDDLISSIPNTVFAFYPVLDLKKVPSNIQSISPYNPNISPVDLISNGKVPPGIIIFQGTSDSLSWTPPVGPQQFCNISLAKNPQVPCGVYPIYQREHGFLSWGFGSVDAYQYSMQKMNWWLIKFGIMGGDIDNVANNMTYASSPVCNQVNNELVSEWSKMFGYPIPQY